MWSAAGCLSLILRGALAFSFRSGEESHPELRRGAPQHHSEVLPRRGCALSGRFWFSMYSLSTVSGALPQDPVK